MTRNTMNFTATNDVAQKIAARAPTDATTIRQFAEARSDVFSINPFTIRVKEDFNVRDFDSAEMKDRVDQFAKAFANGSVIPPFLVQMENNSPTLVDGETRLRGVMRAIEVYGADIRTVRVTTTPRGTSKADLNMMLITQNDGLPLSPLQTGIVIKRNLALGWTEQDVRDATGYTITRIRQLIDLVALPLTVQKMISNGEISATLAGEIAKDCNGDDDQIIATIENAKVTATDNGKAKVTRKSVAPSTDRAPSFKEKVLTGFDGSTVEAVDSNVRITITREQFDAIQPLLGLSALEA